MDTAKISALVKAGAPDHAGHTQELVELDAMDRIIKLMCSCSVGLTLSVPLPAGPPTVLEVKPGPDIDAGGAVVRALDALAKATGKKGG